MHAFGLYSLLGFPLFRSSRLFLRVSYVSLYSFAIITVVGPAPIAGIFFCSDHLILAHLIVFWFHFSSCTITSLFVWRIFYLFDPAHAWIEECEESSPGSAHPS